MYIYIHYVGLCNCQFQTGLGQLQTGLGQLQTGLGQLQTGSGQLQTVLGQSQTDLGWQFVCCSSLLQCRGTLQQRELQQTTVAVYLQTATDNCNSRAVSVYLQHSCLFFFLILSFFQTQSLQVTKKNACWQGLVSKKHSPEERKKERIENT
jgi:X-X-X-Leu-X-X-Gly heptad repeat protein